MYTPYPLYICMFPYTICTQYVMGMWGDLYTHMSWGLLVAAVHLSNISVSVGTSICLSAHNSYTSCSPSLWGSLLDWMPMDVCYASLCCNFLCSVFIMPQASTTTAMTTTPPVTVVYSRRSSLLTKVTMAPSLMGLPATSGQHDVVLLTPRYSGGVCLATVPQQQPPSQIPLLAYANSAMGSPQVVFSFRVEPPTVCIFLCWCLFWCSMLSAFRCHAGCYIHLWGLNHWCVHHCNPLELTHGRHMCNLEVCTEWLLPLLL